MAIPFTSGYKPPGHPGGHTVTAEPLPKANPANVTGESALNKLWLVNSIANDVARTALQVLPEASQGVTVVAIGFAWASLDSVYKFAMCVANGLLGSVPNLNGGSTRTISVKLDHTAKVVVINISIITNGLIAGAVEAIRGDAASLLAAPVTDPIRTGNWPIQGLGPGVNKVVPSLPNGGLLLKGTLAALDTRTQNAGLAFGNMYDQADMLLQSPGYSATICAQQPTPPINKLVAAFVNGLLGISNSGSIPSPRTS